MIITIFFTFIDIGRVSVARNPQIWINITIFATVFDRILGDGLELPDLQYSIIESRSDHGGSARGIGITRKSSTIFFGFVPVGDSQVIDHKIYNRTSEQMRLKCSLLHRSEVFMVR